LSGQVRCTPKNAFPTVAAQVRSLKTGSTASSKATITSEQALAEFDRVVGLAVSGANGEAERILESKSGPDLLLIAKELGVTFPKSKPSIKAMREAIFGKVRESVLLRSITVAPDMPGRDQVHRWLIMTTSSVRKL
jgi:hypothetical protein